MAMSSRRYEKNVLSASFRKSRRVAAKINAFDRLVQQLHDDLSAVSYVWEDDLQRASSLKKIKLLWFESK